jgi:hypothetical protein
MTGNRTLSRLSRRDWLRTTGGVAGSLLTAGGAGGRETVDRAVPAAQTADRRDFLWLNGSLRTTDRLRDNVLAYADRHDLAVVLVKPNANVPNVADIVGPQIEAAVERGVDVWLNTGILTELTAEEFAGDADRREQHLDRLRRLAELYRDRVDDGRIVLWQEAPVSGRWAEGGKWTAESVANLREHGPAVFAAQRGAIKDVAPDVDVGIFVHFPYVVDSKTPETYANLLSSLRDRDAMPDFAFVDFYRGWYEKDVGAGPANDAIRSLITNARDGVDGREVFYMGQAHTINPNHTPSRTAMRQDLWTALDAGADGVGWYSRNQYKRTGAAFDPYVPNVGDPEEFGDRADVSTFTVARDRYQYAWAATHPTRQEYDPRAKFDLWIHTDGIGFHDHSVSLRGAEGDWSFVADIGGYADGDYPYDDGPHVSILRGLDRERFLDGTLDLRVESRAETALRGVYVRPFTPDTFVSEREALSLVSDRQFGSFGRFCLGNATGGEPLTDGETTRVSVDVERHRSPLPLDALVYPDAFAEKASLRRAEREAEFRPLDRFDLWISGTDVAGLDAVNLGGRDALAESVAVARADAAAVAYGVPRSLLAEDSLGTAEVAGGASVDALYAMPYGGSGAFTPPARARELLAEDRDAVETFSLAYARI